MPKVTGLVSGGRKVDKEACDGHQRRTRKVDPGGAAPDPLLQPPVHGCRQPRGLGRLFAARALTLVREPASNDSFKT